ncbi:MAG: CDC27 family protein, partial [Thiovulaceae bacterium]|nr:CDC27 family protein [Sulfurimonadaceae bacterium]
FLISLELFLHASFTNVQSYYDSAEYEKAIAEARASTDEYSNPKLHLLWAKSAQKLGRLDEAMSAYERVVMLDETNIDAKVELAKVYDKTSRIILAKETTKELKNYQLTFEQRNAMELIEGTDIQKIKSKASISFGYDSNINVSAKADELNDYYNILGSNGEKSSSFTRFNGSLSYTNDFDDDGGSYARGDFKVYNQNNFNEHYYDMFIGTLDFGLGYRGDGYNIFIPIGIDKVDYLDTSLMQQYKIEPRIDVKLENDYIFHFNVAYKQRVYNDSEYKAMNDSSYTLGSGLYYLMDKDFIYVNLKYENFSSEKTLSALFIDKQMLTFSAGINYSLYEWLNARLNYRYRDATYDDARDDTYNQIELKVSHFFKDKYELFISDRQVDNSSDYVPANYSKNIAMFGLSMSY